MEFPPRFHRRIATVFLVLCLTVVGGAQAHSASATYDASAPFSQNLELWNTGASVHALQVFLNANGYPIAASGAGSLGHETSTFGNRTYQAVRRFQATHNLPSTGFFGPLTRASANSLAAADENSSGSSGSSATNSPATSGAPSPGFSTAPLPGYAPGQIIFGGGSPAATPPVTISQSAPTLSVTNSPVTYSGSAQAATVTGSVAGTVSSIQYNGSATVPTAAGTYVVTANFAPTDSTDYSALTSASAGNFVINGAAPSVSTSAASSVATSTATLNGAITATGGGNATQSGFAYGIGSTLASPIATSTLGPQTGTASFTQSLTGLTQSTTYYARAYATNSGGTGFGSILSFTESALPVISSIASSSVASSTQTITWTTNVPASSQINYGLTTSYGSASSSAALVTSHSITLTGLTASTTYDFQVLSTDSLGDTAASSTQTFTTAAYTYYVDSVNGSDSNPGTSPSLAFKNITALPTINAGQSVGLAYGSDWRQELDINANNVTVAGYPTTYNSTNLPILDASDVISNASLTADGSGAYYTAPITFIQGGQPAWINVWETGGPGDSATGQFLANVSSQALCDSTPGSYYVAGLTGSNMPTTVPIYIHPTNSSNAITNGYTYEFSNRRAGIYASGANMVVANIEGRKAAGNDGPFDLEGDGNSYLVTGVIARDGNKHVMFVSSGSTVENSLLINSYYAGNYGNLLVAFDSVGHNLPITLSNNIFQQDQKVDSLNSIAAVISHTGSGTMGAVTSTNDWFIAKNSATFSGFGMANISSLTVNSSKASNLQSMFNMETNATINNAQSVSNYSNGTVFAQFLNSGVSATFNNPLACYNSGTTNSSAMYEFQTTNMSVIVNGGITEINGSMYYMFGDNGAAENGIHLTVNNHTFDGTQGGMTAYLFTGTGGSFTGGQAGNANSYNTGKITQWEFNNTNKTTLPAWQAAVTPQDSAAITTGSGASACTLPTIPSVN